jgi:hypothetical protein
VKSRAAAKGDLLGNKTIRVDFDESTANHQVLLNLGIA